MALGRTAIDAAECFVHVQIADDIEAVRVELVDRQVRGSILVLDATARHESSSSERRATWFNLNCELPSVCAVVGTSGHDVGGSRHDHDHHHDIDRAMPATLSDSEHTTLVGFLAGYRRFTRDAYTLDLRQFTAWCWQHGRHLFEVRRVDIESFARELEDRGRARATIARRLCMCP